MFILKNLPLGIDFFKPVFNFLVENIDIAIFEGINQFFL